MTTKQTNHPIIYGTLKISSHAAQGQSAGLLSTLFQAEIQATHVIHYHQTEIKISVSIKKEWGVV